MLMLLCSLAACGNEGTKEHIKTGEERALELQEDAKDAVNKLNQDTLKNTESEELIEME